MRLHLHLSLGEGGMDTVLEDVLNAIDMWLEEIEIDENRVEKMRSRLSRKVLQIRLEGETSIVDVGGLERVADMWTNILNLLCSEKTDNTKRLLLTYVLQLFESSEISMTLTCGIIINIFN